MKLTTWLLWCFQIGTASITTACRTELAGVGESSTAGTSRIERDIRSLVACGTRHTLSADRGTRGIDAARRYLAAEFEKVSAERYGGRLQVRSESHHVAPEKRIPDGADVTNVVALLPGRDPTRLVVVSGHYDSMPSDVMDPESDAPGANDDASGVAVVLECARLLGGLEPRATVVFMAVAGEEQSLAGSTAQAKDWKERGWLVEALFTNDIVGGGRGANGRLEPERVRLFSEGVPSAGDKIVGSDADAPSRQLARYLEEVGEREVPGFDVDLVFRQDRFLRGGDHKPFNELGFAAVRFTEPNENYDHQHQNVRVEGGRQFGDLPEFVDFAFVERVARVNAAGLRALALAPAPPADVMLDTQKLTPHTRLFWTLGAEGSVAGYRVRMRGTTDARWTKSVDVGLKSEITLENTSKDDWLFAVEAYDARGATSLPVYPTPSR
ncbi:MAG: M20/M25/M40 family metallo-hydrolase [Planctomycetes bacterium]|nr:M20/M25/M40 family metallo-hydrolase [Planctomycetota bacterium]